MVSLFHRATINYFSGSGPLLLAGLQDWHLACKSLLQTSQRFPLCELADKAGVTQKQMKTKSSISVVKVVLYGYNLHQFLLHASKVLFSRKYGKVLLLVLSVTFLFFFVCESNISGTAKWICA